MLKQGRLSPSSTAPTRLGLGQQGSLNRTWGRWRIPTGCDARTSLPIFVSENNKVVERQQARSERRGTS
ncbi:unnamed protein product [Scytosiphon promiscuus]